jgi:pyridoxine/pyridoxamine 5'-phosphate oxidase
MYSKIVLMITFKKQSEDPPYLKLREEYNKAESENQKIIEAISVSSYSKSESIVDSRYVNLKIIDDKDFIFFF